MSDRLHELVDLDTDRLGIRPAPAAELRARGDRHRRRRYAGTGLAAATAVVVVGIGASVVGGPGATEPSPAPAPSSTPSSTTSQPTPRPTDAATTVAVPAGFPLAAGYPDTNEDLTPVEVSDQPAVDSIEVCGTPVALDGAADVAGTTFTGVEDFRSRTLLLFADKRGAQVLMVRAEATIAACQVSHGAELTRFEIPLGDESIVFARHSADGSGQLDLGMTVYQLIRVGPAVLIDVASGEANGSAETRASFADHVAQDAAEVVAAMAALTA